MRAFELSVIRCASCGTTQKPSDFRSPCPDCEIAEFEVDIERRSSVVSWEGLAALGALSLGPLESSYILMLVLDDPESLSITGKTQSFLACGEVNGGELRGFLAASAQERSRLYVAWKRRELEKNLAPDQKICLRCAVAFKAYDNDWNRDGCCSRACHHAWLRSSRDQRHV